MKPISLTFLRTQIFKVIDNIIETGIPVVIERKDHKLKIILQENKSKLENLKKRKCIAGNPDEIVRL